MRDHLEAFLWVHKILFSRLFRRFFVFVGALSFLVPTSAFAATTGSFPGGYQSCYQYGVDEPVASVGWASGSSGQIQVQIDFDSGYTPNSGTARYIISSGTSVNPYTADIVWSTAFDGVTSRPWHATKVRYYTATDGFSADDTVDFVVQDTPCGGSSGGGSSSAATTTVDTAAFMLAASVLNFFVAMYGMVLFMVWMRR